MSHYNHFCPISNLLLLIFKEYHELIIYIFAVSVPDKEDTTKVKEEVGSSYGWLEEIEIPRESEMDGIEYMGPQINNHTS